MKTELKQENLTKEFLQEVADKHDLKLYVSENGNNAEKYGHYIEMEYWSDLGEDVIITLVVDELTIEEIVHEMYLYEEDFDAEEHATEWFNMHGEHNAPTSLRALLKDADEQAEKLEEIYNTMVELSETEKYKG